MGRLRTKDFDLSPGWRRKKGRLYYQPTTDRARNAKRVQFSLPDGPMIYFIRGLGGAIKIGFTASRDSLRQRMSMLRVGSPAPLYLMGAVPGSRQDERRAHRDLQLFRREGEWFGRHRIVTAYVRDALRKGLITARFGDLPGVAGDGQKIPAATSTA